MQRRQPGQYFQHVLRMAHQRRALTDEASGDGCAGGQRRAGRGHHLPALLPDHAGGDQRAGALGGFDHDRAPGEVGDDAVAAGEVLRAGLVAGGAFRDDQALFGDLGQGGQPIGRIPEPLQQVRESQRENIRCTDEAHPVFRSASLSRRKLNLPA